MTHRLRFPFVLTFCLFLSGCAVTVDDMRVDYAVLSEGATSYGIFANDKNPKSIFDRAEEQVTLRVRFNYNLVASTQRFRTVWTEPNGQTYVAGPVSTVFGSNRDIIVSLKLAGTSAADKPGRWTVRVFHGEAQIVEESFEVR